MARALVARHGGRYRLFHCRIRWRAGPRSRRYRHRARGPRQQRRLQVARGQVGPRQGQRPSVLGRFNGLKLEGIGVVVAAPDAPDGATLLLLASDDEALGCMVAEFKVVQKANGEDTIEHGVVFRNIGAGASQRNETVQVKHWGASGLCAFAALVSNSMGARPSRPNPREAGGGCRPRKHDGRGPGPSGGRSWSSRVHGRRTVRR